MAYRTICWRVAAAGVGVALTLPSGSAARLCAQQPARASMTAFVDVSVVPMDRERVLAHQTVLVRGDRILMMGPTAQIRIPATAQRVDAHGKFLMPGLGDMHAHHGQDDVTMLLYVANGVTTLRDLGVLDLDDTILPRLRTRIAARELIGPQVYAPIRICTERGQSVRGLSLAQLTDCFRRGKAHGYDSFKIYAHIPAEIDRIVAAAKLAGIRVMGHTPTTPGYGGLDKALAIPYWSIEHLLGYFEAVLGVSDLWTPDLVDKPLPDSVVADTAAWMKPEFRLDPVRLRQVAEATRRAGTWNVPTMAAWDSIYGLMRANTTGPLPLTGRAFGRVGELNRVIVKALQDGGAGLLLGSDYGLPGFSIHGELQAFVRAGLTPYQALATGTKNVAAFFGTERETGTVAVGKRADLLLLDGNPLQDVGYTAGPAGVMVAGRWLPRAELDARLDSLGRYGDVDLKAQRRQVWRDAGQLGAEDAAEPTRRGEGSSRRTPRSP